MDTINSEIPKEKVGYFRSTDRNLKNYQDTFTFNPQELKPESRILDVGSGTHQAFARGLKEVRPDIEVVSVDPTLFISEYEVFEKGEPYPRSITEKEKVTRRRQKFGPVVAAMAPDLPFIDNSFDYIFDNHSAFMYLPPDVEILKSYLSELIRITKPGGQINIFPLDIYLEAWQWLDNPSEIANNVKPRILNLMEELGVEEYQTFNGEEELLDNKTMNRLGIKFIKP